MTYSVIRPLSVSKKSTRCQENEYFIFLSCIIFFLPPAAARK